MNFAKLSVISFVLLSALPGRAMELQYLGGHHTEIDKLHKANMWTLVIIWSLDCVACEQQKPMLSRFHKDHSLSNAQVVGIVSDGDKSRKPIQKRVDRKPTSFSHYIPKTSKFEDEYFSITGTPFKGTPTYLVYDKSGKLAGVHEGTLLRKQLETIVGPATRLQTPSADLIR